MCHYLCRAIILRNILQFYINNILAPPYAMWLTSTLIFSLMSRNEKWWWPVFRFDATLFAVYLSDENAGASVMAGSRGDGGSIFHGNTLSLCEMRWNGRESKPSLEAVVSYGRDQLAINMYRASIIVYVMRNQLCLFGEPIWLLSRYQGWWLCEKFNGRAVHLWRSRAS